MSESDPKVLGPEGEQLSVFTDGEIVVTFADGSEAVESFEGAGQEMELEFTASTEADSPNQSSRSATARFDRAQPVERITFRQTAATSNHNERQ